jgi:hypothetical protein
MSEYQPDKMETHLMYIIEAGKNSPHDKCLDRITGKVHSRDECEALIAFLKNLGYRLQVNRVNSTQIVDDEMPGEEDEEN